MHVFVVSAPPPQVVPFTQEAPTVKETAALQVVLDAEVHPLPAFNPKQIDIRITISNKFFKTNLALFDLTEIHELHVNHPTYKLPIHSLISNFLLGKVRRWWVFSE